MELAVLVPVPRGVNQINEVLMISSSQTALCNELLTLLSPSQSHRQKNDDNENVEAVWMQKGDNTTTPQDLLLPPTSHHFALPHLFALAQSVWQIVMFDCSFCIQRL